MSIFHQWHPMRFIEALKAIDKEASENKKIVDYRKPAIVLFTMAICLLLIHYLKFSSTFQQSVVLMFGKSAYVDLRGSLFFHLYSNAWWAAWHLIGYVLIPVFVIRVVLKERLSDYGTGIGATRQYFQYYVALALPIVFFAFLVSFREDFANHYPFYRFASRSWADLLMWECLYIVQFVALEFFFRGFVLHACKPQFGAAAIFVMMVPYLMIHFPKPWLEATGAIPFGILLGVLALRSRSMWGGVGVHVTIALSMDLLALLQSNRLPTRWWP